jgi:hypothetical protein
MSNYSDPRQNRFDPHRSEESWIFQSVCVLCDSTLDLLHLCRSWSLESNRNTSKSAAYLGPKCIERLYSSVDHRKVADSFRRCIVHTIHSFITSTNEILEKVGLGPDIQHTVITARLTILFKLALVSGFLMSIPMYFNFNRQECHHLERSYRGLYILRSISRDRIS